MIEKEDWSNEVEELEVYFKSVTLPTEPIQLDSCTTVIEPYKMIQNHLSIIKYNNCKRTFKQYLIRLNKLKEIIDGHER